MTWSVAAKTCLALVSGVLAVAGITPPAPAAADPSLRVAAVQFGAPTQVVVAVPADLATQALPASAFQVTQGGSTLPVSVARVTDSGMDVYVVVDTTVARPTLAAQQSAAAEFLRNLPPAVRTATVGSGAAGSAVPPVQPGNVDALRDLSLITPQSTATIGQTLTAIAALPTAGRRRVIVLLTDCEAAGEAQLLPSIAALGRSGEQQLDVVASGSGCPQDLPSLAAQAGGLAVAGQPLERLDQALDTLLLDLLGQYRLSVPASARGQSLTVSVDQAGVRASAEVGTAAPQRSDPARKAGGTSRVLLAVLVVLAGVVIAVAASAFRRAGRPLSVRPPPPVAPAQAPEATGPPPLRPVIPVAATTPPGRPPEEPAGWSPAALPGFVSTGVTDATIRVRLPELADAAALQAYAEQDDGTADRWVPVPTDDDETDWIALVDSWVQTWRAESGGGVLSLLVERCQDGRIVGYIGLQVSPRVVDITYGTAPAWRSHGYATGALRLIATWLADANPARPVRAIIPPEHDASCNVAREAGFYPAGVDRNFVPETGKVELYRRYVFRPGAAGEAQP